MKEYKEYETIILYIKSKDIFDKIVPKFDANHPDTKFNKVRFKYFLQVELTQDIIVLTMLSVLTLIICSHSTAKKQLREILFTSTN